MSGRSSCIAATAALPCPSRCGDGRRQCGEACDDGNLMDDDGCSSACQVETGFQCFQSKFNVSDFCVPFGPEPHQIFDQTSLNLSNARIGFTLLTNSSRYNLSFLPYYDVCSEHSFVQLADPPAAFATKLAFVDDEVEFVPLPSPFTFYGTPFSAVYISANGFLSFEDARETSRESWYPSKDAFYHFSRISPFWADLKIAGGSVSIQYFQSFRKRLSITWTNVTLQGLVQTFTFQATLFLDGSSDIRFSYEKMPEFTYTTPIVVGLSAGNTIRNQRQQSLLRSHQLELFSAFLEVGSSILILQSSFLKFSSLAMYSSSFVFSFWFKLIDRPIENALRNSSSVFSWGEMSVRVFANNSLALVVQDELELYEYVHSSQWYHVAISYEADALCSWYSAAAVSLHVDGATVRRICPRRPLVNSTEAFLGGKSNERTRAAKFSYFRAWRQQGGKVVDAGELYKRAFCEYLQVPSDDFGLKLIVAVDLSRFTLQDFIGGTVVAPGGAHNSSLQSLFFSLGDPPQRLGECSNDCSAQIWATQLALAAPCQGLCGDGQRARFESCEDGNVVGGDGCSLSCRLEDGFACDLDISVGLDECSRAQCGDSLVAVNLEQCDDGNDEARDGCFQCRIEEGWHCSGTSCWPVCGDGKLEGHEECDDSNQEDGDGCSALCQIEPGFLCNEFCVAICGNGERAVEEECDDGNEEGGDGCSPHCLIEEGWACRDHFVAPEDASRVPPPGQQVHSVCYRSVCGDSWIDGNEQCDDGNPWGGDGCSEECKLEPDYLVPQLLAFSVTIFSEFQYCQIFFDKTKISLSSTTEDSPLKVSPVVLYGDVTSELIVVSFRVHNGFLDLSSLYNEIDSNIEAEIWKLFGIRFHAFSFPFIKASKFEGSLNAINVFLRNFMFLQPEANFGGDFMVVDLSVEAGVRFLLGQDSCTAHKALYVHKNYNDDLLEFSCSLSEASLIPDDEVAAFVPPNVSVGDPDCDGEIAEEGSCYHELYISTPASIIANGKLYTPEKASISFTGTVAEINHILRTMEILFPFHEPLKNHFCIEFTVFRKIREFAFFRVLSELPSPQETHHRLVITLLRPEVDRPELFVGEEPFDGHLFVLDFNASVDHFVDFQVSPKVDWHTNSTAIFVGEVKVSRGGLTLRDEGVTTLENGTFFGGARLQFRGFWEEIKETLESLKYRCAPAQGCCLPHVAELSVTVVYDYYLQRNHQYLDVDEVFEEREIDKQTSKALEDVEVGPLVEAAAFIGLPRCDSVWLDLPKEPVYIYGTQPVNVGKLVTLSAFSESLHVDLNISSTSAFCLVSRVEQLSRFVHPLWRNSFCLLQGEVSEVRHALAFLHLKPVSGFNGSLPVVLSLSSSTAELLYDFNVTVLHEEEKVAFVADSQHSAVLHILEDVPFINLPPLHLSTCFQPTVHLLVTVYPQRAGSVSLCSQNSSLKLSSADKSTFSFLPQNLSGINSSSSPHCFIGWQSSDAPLRLSIKKDIFLQHFSVPEGIRLAFQPALNFWGLVKITISQATHYFPDFQNSTFLIKVHPLPDPPPLALAPLPLAPYQGVSPFTLGLLHVFDFSGDMDKDAASQYEALISPSSSLIRIFVNVSRPPLKVSQDFYGELRLVGALEELKFALGLLRVTPSNHLFSGRNESFRNFTVNVTLSNLGRPQPNISNSSRSPSRTLAMPISFLRPTYKPAILVEKSMLFFPPLKHPEISIHFGGLQAADVERLDSFSLVRFSATLLQPGAAYLTLLEERGTSVSIEKSISEINRILAEPDLGLKLLPRGGETGSFPINLTLQSSSRSFCEPPWTYEAEALPNTWKAVEGEIHLSRELLNSNLRNATMFSRQMSVSVWVYSSAGGSNTIMSSGSTSPQFAFSEESGSFCLSVMKGSLVNVSSCGGTVVPSSWVHVGLSIDAFKEIRAVVAGGSRDYSTLGKRCWLSWLSRRLSGSWRAKYDRSS